MISDLERFRSDTVDFLASVLDISPDADAVPLTELLQNALYLALGPGSGGFAGLTPAVQAALYNYQDQIGTLGLGILQDGIDAGSDINATDILVTLGHDEVGNGGRSSTCTLASSSSTTCRVSTWVSMHSAAFLADGAGQDAVPEFHRPVEFQRESVQRQRPELQRASARI